MLLLLPAIVGWVVGRGAGLLLLLLLLPLLLSNLLLLLVVILSTVMVPLPSFVLPIMLGPFMLLLLPPAELLMLLILRRGGLLAGCQVVLSARPRERREAILCV